MPYVTSVERLAKKEGRREGRQEGRREGRHQGARAELLRTIATGLKKKFGSAGARLLVRVRALDDLARLRALADALIEIESLEDFRDLLK